MRVTPHPIYPSTVLVGLRRANAGDPVESVLVSIVKGTFRVDDPTAAPEPQQAPLLEADELFNPLLNPAFDAEEPGLAFPGWTATTNVSRVDGDTISPKAARLTGSGSLSQSAPLPEPLGGRSFTLGLRARATAVGGATLGAKLGSADGTVLFDTTRSLASTAFQSLAITGTWPAGLADSGLRLELRRAGGSAALELSAVHLHEGLDTPEFNEAVRREHDLATFKPFADIVVLGSPAPPPADVAGASLVDDRWTETVVSGARSRLLSFTNSAIDTHRATTLPWEPRRSAERGPDGHAGARASLDTFDPGDGLPEGFVDDFHSGGDYGGAARPDFERLGPGAVVELQADASYRVGADAPFAVSQLRRLHLPAEAPKTRVVLRSPAGLESTSRVDMNADTVVYDKRSETFEITWRASFPSAQVPPERVLAVDVWGGV